MNADENQISLPQTVSRYFPDKEYAYNEFETGRLWVSNATDFNDPFDVLPAFGNVASQITDRQRKIEFAFTSPRGPDWNQYRKANQSETELVRREATELGPHILKASFTKKNGVICFVAKPDNIVMWAHYASNHQGFVLEFDVSHQFFSPPFFQRVDYHKAEDRPRAENPDRLRTVSTKAKGWEYEEEFRLIRPRESLLKDERLDAKPGQYADLPTEAIKAIYFGCRMSPTRREQLLKVLQQSKHKNILPFQMFPDTSDYRLVPESWSESVRERADFFFQLECLAKEEVNFADSAPLQDLLMKRFQK